jgi:outer membrane immunogenic protein
VFSWTGFYIGGNLGAAWTQGNVNDSFGSSWSNSQQAVFTGGGQVGANYQINWLVVGVEADFDWMANNHNSSNTVFVPGVGNLQLSANDRWITTLAARVGVAFNNWLFYAKGDGGWVGVNSPTLGDILTATHCPIRSGEAICDAGHRPTVRIKLLCILAGCRGEFACARLRCWLPLSRRWS